MDGENDGAVVDLGGQTETGGVDVSIEGAKTPDSKIVKPEEGIESLRDQMERSRRESAERLSAKDRQLQEMAQRARAAEAEASTVKKSHVDTIIDNISKDKEAHRTAYRVAMEAGDFSAAAEAQDKLSLANARLVEAERGKVELASSKSTQGRVADGGGGDATSSVSPRAAAFIREHPHIMVNGQLTPLALQAHYGAVAKGLALDSDEYFDHIRGVVTPGERQQTETRGRDAGGRSSISAPVGREPVASPGGSQNGGQVRLTASEARTALETLRPIHPDKSDMDLYKIYARNMQELISEQKITRNA